jgi:hypothetical protein
MTQETIKVSTRQYVKKHGHEPRGRFLWTFKFEGERMYFSMRGEYETCLAEAVRRAEGRGSRALMVSSVTYGQDEGR